MTTLVFSHPGLSAMPKMAESKVDKVSRPIPNQFTVTISGTVPPGLYEVRAAGPAGISNPRTFVVGTLNEVVDRDPPAKLPAARDVPLESTVQRHDALRGGRLFQIRRQEGAARAARNFGPPDRFEARSATGALRCGGP